MSDGLAGGLKGAHDVLVEARDELLVEPTARYSSSRRSYFQRLLLSSSISLQSLLHCPIATATAGADVEPHSLTSSTEEALANLSAVASAVARRFCNQVQTNKQTIKHHQYNLNCCELRFYK